MTATADIATAETISARAAGEGGEPASWLGVIVGARYRILEHLASGGMGHVFLASDCQLERRVAVKLLAGNFSPERAWGLLEEARLLAKLKHPSIVRMFDSGVMMDGT